MDKNKQKETLKKVLKFIQKYWILMIVSIVLSLISVVATLYIPILVGQTIDFIVGVHKVDFDAITQVLKTILVVAFIASLSQWLMNVINNRVSFHIIQDMRRLAFDHLQHLPLSYLDSHQDGDIVSRMIGDVDQVGDGLLLGFSQLFKGIMTIIITLYFMMSIRFSIALVVVVLTPISLFVARFIATRTYKMFRKQSQIRGNQTAFIDEYIGHEKVVQAFGHEAKAIEDFDSINDELQKCSLKAVFFSSLTNPSTRFVNAIVYGAVAFTGASFVIEGLMSVGQLTSLLSYANQYTKPFNEISGVITELQNALACASRIFDLLDVPEEAADCQDSDQLKTIKGQVDLEHVYFSYSQDKPLIEDLNLSILPGQRVAIVGPTGCGKTTLINLLMRFYSPLSGTISIDGHPIDQMSKQSLRHHYGMVLQETWLKGVSVKDNLLLACPQANDQEIIEAAKKAYAHNFIMKLPHGYDTVLEENGGNLSQGQKQLLCITRVMLALPPMLILDEATSSIDIRTEAKIQEAFQKMMEGRTTFIVAHRLSTIKEADVILVMNQGHIVESGNHHQLLEKNGFYAKLYNSQFEH